MITNKNYSGMTFVEAIVSILIFTIAIGGFSMLFVRIWRINSYSLEMGQASQGVSRGVSTAVNYLRKIRQADNGAYPVQSVGNNDMVVFSDYDKDGVTERLHLYLENQQLKMGTTKPTGTMPKVYQSGDQEVKIIADNIVNTSSEPIFYYYNKDYPGDVSHNPLILPADVSIIRLVKILLKVNIDPNRAPENIQIQSFVEFRNLNDYDRMK